MTYGSGRESKRALYCRYCLFCSSEPVTSSIHLAAMSLASFVELFEPFREEAPGPPELIEVLLTRCVERVDLAWRALLGRDLLHVHETLLLKPHEDRVHGALGDVGEALVAEPGRDLVPIGGSHGQDRED